MFCHSRICLSFVECTIAYIECQSLCKLPGFMQWRGGGLRIARLHYSTTQCIFDPSLCSLRALRRIKRIETECKRKRPAGLQRIVWVINAAHATIACCCSQNACNGVFPFPVALEAFALNLFTRNKPSADTSAPKPLAPTFLSLPPLKQRFRFQSFVCGPARARPCRCFMTHLDNAWRHQARVVLLGAAGLGKSSALAFIAAQERVPVYSYADYHSQALPQKFVNTTCILLDDVSESVHVAHLEALARQYPDENLGCCERCTIHSRRFHRVRATNAE